MIPTVSHSHFSPIQNASSSASLRVSKVISAALQMLWKGSTSTYSMSYTLLDGNLDNEIIDFIKENVKFVDFKDLFVRRALGVVVQAAFYKVAKRVLPDKDLVVLFCNITLAALVSIIASTVLFGLVSLAGGVGLTSVVTSTLAGITIGILQCHYGLTSEAFFHKLKEIYYS